LGKKDQIWSHLCVSQIDVGSTHLSQCPEVAWSGKRLRQGQKSMLMSDFAQQNIPGGLSGYFYNASNNKFGRILKKYFVLSMLRPSDIGPALLMIKQEIKNNITQGLIFITLLSADMENHVLY
jgi:hypothetical protein